MKALQDCHLYGILDTGYVAKDGLLAMAKTLVDGGIDIVQFRAKGWSADAVRRVAEKVLPITRAGGVPFIINDHPDIAVAIGCEGIHVGQDDMSIADVRAIVGGECLVGKSTHSLAQAEGATAEQIDYIGFGPLLATPTKPDYVPIGMEDIAEVHRRVELPIFCIGGIKRENLETVVTAGAQRAVIVSGILQADDVPAYIRDCHARLGVHG